MVPVIFRREEVEIIRREPGQSWSPEAALGEGVEVTRIPINAWEPVVGKEAFVSREVVVDKRSVTEEQQITGLELGYGPNAGSLTVKANAKPPRAISLEAQVNLTPNAAPTWQHADIFSSTPFTLPCMSAWELTSMLTA